MKFFWLRLLLVGMLRLVHLGRLESFNLSAVGSRRQPVYKLAGSCRQHGERRLTLSGIFHVLSCQHDVCRQNLTDVSTCLRQFRHCAEHNDGKNRRERESRRRDRLPFARRANVGRVAKIADLPVRLARILALQPLNRRRGAPSSSFCHSHTSPFALPNLYARTNPSHHLR